MVSHCHALQPPPSPKLCAALALCSLCTLPFFVLVGSSSMPGGDLTQAGMRAFEGGHIEESIRRFDMAAESGYPRALLWQRGLSLFYAGRFEEGARQFREDVAMNPNDTEESIWAMLCEAKLHTFDAARRDMLAVGRDARQVMRAAYDLFRGEEESKASLLASASGGGASDQFYAALYLGLFAEAQGDEANARQWLKSAAASAYTRGSGGSDYMVSVVRIHLRMRGWEERSDL